MDNHQLERRGRITPSAVRGNGEIFGQEELADKTTGECIKRVCVRAQEEEGTVCSGQESLPAAGRGREGDDQTLPRKLPSSGGGDGGGRMRELSYLRGEDDFLSLH